MDRINRPAGLEITRRDAVALGLGAVAAAAAPKDAHATPDEVSDSISQTFGAGAMNEGRIVLTVPKLAETGNSVPVTVTIDSPMTDADHVRRIAIFAEQNPRPKVVEVFLSPASGEAIVETNVRLSGTQNLVAIAEMSDGSLWRTLQHVRVVVGACTALPARF